MDKLAKRAGVTALVLIASAGSALTFGLFRMASSLDQASLNGDKQAPPQVVAAIQLPDAVITTFTGETPLVAPPAAAGPNAQAAPRSVKTSALLVNRPRPTRAPLRVAAAPKPAHVEAKEPPMPVLDGLDVNLGMKARERSLDDRGSRAFTIRQLSGADPLRKPSTGGERITFETDLGRPDR